MHLDEYMKVKDLTYRRYCDYLQAKYGIPKLPYMTKNWNKTIGNSRTLEGLVIHHKYEDSAIMLSTKDYAMWHPYEWQMPENLIYCDYLEHLLLHVLICMYPAVRPEDSGEIVGIGGVENYIVPELNDVYSGFKSKQAWRSACYEHVLQDEDVYLHILDQFLGCYRKREQGIKQLLTSYNSERGLWEKENNKLIFQKIKNLGKGKKT